MAISFFKYLYLAKISLYLIKITHGAPFYNRRPVNLS